VRTSHSRRRGTASRSLPPCLLLVLSACAASPVHPRALEQVRRGWTHLDAGDLDRSEVAFEHALEIAPDLPEARVGLAAALRVAGRTEEALLHLDHAVGVDPDLAEGHANRGEALAALGRGDEAAAAFSAALRVDPDQVPARIDRARLAMRRAAGEDAAGRAALLDRARRDLLHALEAWPASPLVHEDLGWVEIQRGDVAAAARAYLRAVELSPASATAVLGACAALALSGDCTAAAAACRRCVTRTSAGTERDRCARNLSALSRCHGGGAAAEPVPQALPPGKAKGAPARADTPSRDAR
jgi:tetratricopeptide (TPR) repeat protein